MCQIFIIFLFLIFLYTSFPLFSSFPLFLVNLFPLVTRGPKKILVSRNPFFRIQFFSAIAILRFPGSQVSFLLDSLFSVFPRYLVIWLSGFSRFPFSPMATRGPKKKPGFLKAFFSDSIFFRDRDFKVSRFPGILPPRFLVFCFSSLSGYLIIWIFSFSFFPHGYSGAQKKPWFPETLFFGFNFFPRSRF